MYDELHQKITELDLFIPDETNIKDIEDIPALITGVQPYYAKDSIYNGLYFLRSIDIPKNIYEQKKYKKFYYTIDRRKLRIGEGPGKNYSYDNLCKYIKKKSNINLSSELYFNIHSKIFSYLENSYEIYKNLDDWIVYKLKDEMYCKLIQADAISKDQRGGNYKYKLNFNNDPYYAKYMKYKAKYIKLKNSI